MHIQVTAQDIARSRALRANQEQWDILTMCPIALALRRRGHPNAMVGHEFVHELGEEPKRLPPEALRFVRQFYDRAVEVEPLEFDLPGV